MKYALLALVLLCGCSNSTDEWYQELQRSEAAMLATMEFEVGDLVNIKLGGQGMVVDRSGGDYTYLIRTGPDENYKQLWFDEFELERP